MAESQMSTSWKISRSYLNAILALQHLQPTSTLISQVLGKSRNSFSASRKDELRRTGLISGGRSRGEALAIGPGLGYAVAITVTDKALYGALVDTAGELHCETEVPIGKFADLEKDSCADVLASLRILVGKVIAHALQLEYLWYPALSTGNRGSILLHGINVAWPWIVHRDGHVVGASHRHRSWEGQDLRGLVHKSLKDIVDIEHVHANNRVNCAAMAFAYEDALCTEEEASTFSSTEAPKSEEKWKGSLLTVHLSSGIGASTVVCANRRPDRLSFIDAPLVIGAHGFAGELGHIPIHREVVGRFFHANTVPDTDKCSCGRTIKPPNALDPHLEQVAGARAILARINSTRSASEHLTLDELYYQIKSHHTPETVVRELAFCHKLVGVALKAPVAMTDPGKIVISGPLAFERCRSDLIEGGRHWDGMNLLLDYEFRPNDWFWDMARGAGLMVLRRSVFRGYLVDGTFTKDGGPRPVVIGSNMKRYSPG